MIKNKILVSFAIILVAVVLLEFKVYAATPTFNYKCTRGVNGYYYKDSSVMTYSDHIDNARWIWEHTGVGANPIYLSLKDNTQGTIVDFYGEDGTFWGIYAHRVLAETRYFNGSGTILNPDTSNWLYSEIYVNNDTMSKINDQERQGTMSHELGHAFGLAHWPDNNINQYSIMCQLNQGRKVFTVQAVDNEAINLKY